MKQKKSTIKEWNPNGERRTRLMTTFIYMYVAVVVLASLVSMAVTSYVTYRKWTRAAKDNELILCDGTLYKVIPTDILYFTTDYGWFQTKAMRSEITRPSLLDDDSPHAVIVEEPADKTKPVYNGCKIKFGHCPIIWEVLEWIKITNNRMVLIVKSTGEIG